MFEVLKQLFKRKKPMSILPANYFRGYRRIAANVAEIETVGPNCGSCRHAIAFATWWCELGFDCKYERCFTVDELTPEDQVDAKIVGLSVIEDKLND